MGKCLRNLSILFNLIFFLGGLAMLGIGVWVELDSASFSATLPLDSQLFADMSYIMIAVGAAVAFLAFLGCCGTWKDSKWMLVTFTIIMILIIVAEGAAVVMAFLFTSHFDSIIGTSAIENIKQYYGQTSTLGISATQAWDALQLQAGCCGYTNGYDYTGSLYDAQDVYTNPWPSSCCVTVGGLASDFAGCTTSTSATASHYLTGCSTRLYQLISAYAPLAGGVCAGIVVVQILAVIFAIINISNMGKKNKIGAVA